MPQSNNRWQDLKEFAALNIGTDKQALLEREVQDPERSATLANELCGYVLTRGCGLCTRALDINMDIQTIATFSPALFRDAGRAKPQLASPEVSRAFQSGPGPDRNALRAI